jgi:hypothetical protein
MEAPILVQGEIHLQNDEILRKLSVICRVF